jgi:hypothetical protein
MAGVVRLSVGVTGLVIAGIAFGELGVLDNGRVMQGPWWHGSAGYAVPPRSQQIAAPRLSAGPHIGLLITAS